MYIERERERERFIESDIVQTQNYGETQLWPEKGMNSVNIKRFIYKFSMC